MRSKNSVPVQVILAQSPMGSNHSVHRGAFEEALQSSIEASLRTSGTAPTLRVFSSLYHRSKPHSNNDQPGPSSMLANRTLLPPSDNGEGEIDIKPDVADLNRELAWQNRITDEQQSPDVTPSGHSTVSPREQQQQQSEVPTSSRGPPPLLVPQAFMRPSIATTSSSDLATQNNNRHLLQRLPSMLPKNLPIEQLKHAQEQVKHLQQIQRWHLLQQQHRQQQARAVAANSLSISRLPLFNPLMSSSALNRNALMNPGSAINGAHAIPAQESPSGANNQQTSPGSPMFRKGFCKGGKDIRLSTLKRDGTQIVRYPSDYTLVAMSISPSTPQISKSPGGYHPPDIPSEAMVVLAISIKCLPPNQQELSRPLLAQCAGCGESSLQTFATLSSHINLRTASPAHTNISLSGVNPLQRHARNFIIRDTNMPHGCIRGPIIPWQASDMTPPRITTAEMMPMLPTAPHRPKSGILPQVPARPQLKYKPGQIGNARTGAPGSQPTRPSLLPPGGVSISHRDLIMKPQPTTSGPSPILLDSPRENGPQKEPNLAAEWSPISSGGSEDSPATSDALVQSRADPDWNSTVKLPENLPNYVGRPLILICWEWQQLQSNIQNVHITHSYVKCFEEALTDCHSTALTPLTKEMCYFVAAQYLSTLENHDFLTPSALSAWLGRSRLMLSSMRQVQMTTAHVIALVRMIASNCLHKIGLIISQISQAHAINECIANLKPGGPSFHLVAHINGDTILDLSILLTGHTSRLTREYLHTSDECAEIVQQSTNSHNFVKIDKEISASDLNEGMKILSNSLRTSLYTFRPAFAPSSATLHPLSSTSSISMTSKKFLAGDDNNCDSKIFSTSSTMNIDNAVTSDENNNDTRFLRDNSEHAAVDIAETLFSHVASLCEDNSKMDLSHFSSIQFYLFLPPSPVSRAETTEDVAASGVLEELNVCQTPSLAELRKVIFTSSLKSKQRFRALCEHIKINSSTLFLLFCLDAHLHCDMNSVGSEWMSTLINEIMPLCRNLLLVSCTHIPQALLNQNTSIPFENVIFSKTKSANISPLDHCRSLQSTDVTFDLKHETEFVRVMDSLPGVHSCLIQAKLLAREYIAALALNVSSHPDMTGEGKSHPNNDGLRRLTSPVTTSIVTDLLLSKSGITVLLRIPSEYLAAKFASELISVRDKLKMQEAFEIMLYSSQTKPQLSEYFLQMIRNQKNKSDDWVPETFSEIECLPLLLIYTGKDIANHMLPHNVRYIDLRLLGSNSECLTQSSILSEISLVQSYTQTVSSSTNNTQLGTNCEPPTKKIKSDSDDDALHMDTFSDDSVSGNEHQLKWRSFDDKHSDIKEFSSDEDTEKTEKSSRKRALPLENDIGVESKPDKETTRSISPTVILAKNMHSYVESYLQGTQKFSDLLTHSNCEWTSHTRTIVNEKLSDTLTAGYLRKWTKPAMGHPDFLSTDTDEAENSRSILLVTPPRNKIALACCLFTKKMNQVLLKMLQVEVYDHRVSSTIKPRYPLPNVDLLPEYPVHTTILDMDFDTSIINSKVTNASQIANGLKELDSELGAETVTTAPCMAGKLSALDVNHQACEVCRSHPASQMSTVHKMSVPNCGVSQQTVCDGTLPLGISFVIPQESRHHFVFQHLADANPPQALALNLHLRDDSGIKTPVFSLGVSGAQHGLFNLDHTLYTMQKPRSLISHEIENGRYPDPMHVIVVHNFEVEEFKKAWPDRILMTLPESFDDLGIGAMKYAVQCVMQHSVSVRQEQHSAFQDNSTLGDIWPFALVLDDSCVLWTMCAASELEASPNGGIVTPSPVKTWKNVSLVDLLERIESVPCVERYAAIGIRPWSSEMEIPKSEEDFSGDVVSSGFSKCHLTSCIAVNASLTKENVFDLSKFLHEDIDWCTRLAAADLPLFRFNDIAVATKVMSSPARNKLTSIESENPQGLVSLADSDFKPFMRHPSHLLEEFLAQLGHTVFPKAKGNSRHPVLVVDHYISLGPEVHVEFASSKPDALPWAMDTEKTFSGLLLYGQSNEMSQNFLQHFKFTSGATVCVVGCDRSSLRQTVVNLHLENDWHFRLTDEYQTTNETSKRKPLFYLTGVARSTR